MPIRFAIISEVSENHKAFPAAFCFFYVYPGIHSFSIGQAESPVPATRSAPEQVAACFLPYFLDKVVSYLYNPVTCRVLIPAMKGGYA